MEYSSKGIVLSCSTTQTGTYQTLYGLSNVPEMGGSPEKIDVTNLEDANKRYIDGIVDYGDLQFNFFYNKEDATDLSNAEQIKNSYATLRAYQLAKTKLWFKLTYPDGTGHQWQGSVSVKRDAQGVNSALSFTLTTAVCSSVTDIMAASE